MTIIEFLILGVIIYYALGYLIKRILLPMLFQGLVNKAQQGAQQQYKQNQSSKRQTDNAVKVDVAPKTKSSIPDSEGDYIDFEEVK